MLQSICPLVNSLFFQSLVGFAVMLLGINAMIYLCNFIFYRFSPVRSFPDVTTLSGWAMLGLLVAFVCPIAFFSANWEDYFLINWSGRYFSL